MAEGNTKNHIFFISMQKSLPSANTRPPHLRNSFYLTSQNSKTEFAAFSQKTYLRSDCSLGKAESTEGLKAGVNAGWGLATLPNWILLLILRRVRKECYRALFYLRRPWESLRTHSSNASRSPHRHRAVRVPWFAESMERKRPICSDWSIHPVSSTPPAHRKPSRSRKQTKQAEIISYY